MKKLLIFLCAMFLVFAFSATVSAVPVMLPDVYDADKTWSDDTLLCWAAAASNSLAYTGWDGGFANEDDILAFFAEHWTDDFGSAYHAIYWFFTGDVLPGYSHDASEDGLHTGFYDVGYWEGNGYEDPVDAWFGITDYVDRNADPGNNTNPGIDLVLEGETYEEAGYNHSVSLWGYDDDMNNDGTPGDYSIFITDNEDGGPDNVIEYALLFDSGLNYYFIDDFVMTSGRTSDNFYIASVYRLNSNTEGILPNETNGPPPIPEPATILLLGSGLLGLSSRLRKRKQS